MISLISFAQFNEFDSFCRFLWLLLFRHDRMNRDQNRGMSYDYLSAIKYKSRCDGSKGGEIENISFNHSSFDSRT